MKKITKIFIVIDLIVIFILGLMLGPLKKSIINNNLNKQVLLNTLYKANDIKKSLSSKTNLTINNKVETEPKLVEVKETKMNEYDIEILTPNEDNNDYKLMNLKIGGFDAFLVALYDPTKVHLISKEVLGTDSGEKLINMCNRYEK